ncbi:peptide ABC transporter substrate-binding protein [Kutzneria albida]|uniref:Solute-binding protein family 5 domain-containing protein n=1 Tax=Kutzneria albida DSM 43870 TaxID=1449976 RepID=W5WUJ1_9PSEU|nr:peptide ABC transporter substrate-binding protein [Kutzneria albida]AHI01820.1 hypothetical protein KALB_8463 [Kutzneria albida DSM 43870]
MRRWRSAAALLLCSLLAACSGIAPVTRLGSTGGTPVRGGTVVMALPPAATPNWILPIGIPGYLASYNSAISRLLFQPLYRYHEVNGSLVLDEAADLADPPRYAEDGRTVTIPLRPGRKWTNGRAVSARDVQFWFDLIKANKTRWGGYSPGALPDNVTALEVVDEHTVRLRLDRSYNPDWFTGNQLTAIVPMPQAEWDPQGQARTEDGAKAVFARLVDQARKLAEYATNPLWKVVDGPWLVEEFSTGGRVSIVPNPNYTGADKPHLDRVVFAPFTTANSEFTVLRSGGVDYGYVPPSTTARSDSFTDLGYRVEPWRGWAITYVVYNFNSPTAGPLLRQLYLRQAIQHLINQDAISKVVWHEAATPTHGPVPGGRTPDPYPYDVDRARALLAEHGWRVEDGTAVCRTPRLCGPGIAEGTPLRLTLLSQSGSVETSNMMQEIKSSLGLAGIDLLVREQPLNTVLSSTAPCQSGDPGCDWQLSFFGTAASWYFDADPSGEQIFATGASSNLGSYSDTTTDELVGQTEHSADPAAIQRYNDHVARDLPVAWVPNPAYQVSVIRNDLRGVRQNPLVTLDPQNWYYVR